MPRWVVCAAWTGEESLSGYDYDEVVSTHATREEAQAECARVHRAHLGEVKVEDQLWCIGVGIAPEPEPPYGPSPDYDRDGYWADCVPEEFSAPSEGEV